MSVIYCPHNHGWMPKVSGAPWPLPTKCHSERHVPTRKRLKMTTKKRKMAKKRHKMTTKRKKKLQRLKMTTKRHKTTTKRLKVTTKRHKATTKRHKMTTKWHKMTTKRHKTSTKRHKMTTKWHQKTRSVSLSAHAHNLLYIGSSTQKHSEDIFSNSNHSLQRNVCNTAVCLSSYWWRLMRTNV